MRWLPFEDSGDVLGSLIGIVAVPLTRSASCLERVNRFSGVRVRAAAAAAVSYEETRTLLAEFILTGKVKVWQASSIQ
jgi:hypothetical protein